MKKVSIIVATYRREAELERALRSVAEQTYTNLEVILVDDNGDPEWSAKAAAIVDAIRECYPELAVMLIVNGDNLGSAKARNVGIGSATGEYVTFLDDDDVYLPEKVARQAGFMEQEGLDYSISDLYLYNKSGKVIDKRIRSYIRETTPEALMKYHLMHHMTGTDTLMFRRSYLNTLGGFGPDNVGDEYYLIQRAIDGGGRFGYLPGCDVKAFIHTTEGGVSSGDGKIQGENKLYTYKKKYFGKLDPATRRYIRMRHYAVIAFAEIRRRNVFPFLKNAATSFLCSPVQCITMLYTNYLKK